MDGISSVYWGNKKCTHNFFFRQPQGEGSCKRRMHGRANNIKMDLRGIEFETGNM